MKNDPQFCRFFNKAYNCANLIQKYMSEVHSVAQAKTMRSGVNVEANVKSKSDPRTVNLKSGGTIDVCDAVIADAEGEENEMKLTLWGDDIKAVNVGDKVVITNGYTNEFKGDVSLTKGKFGKMEINP